MALHSGVVQTSLNEAEQNSHSIKNMRMGAVIFKGSRIFGSGANKIRSCSVIKNKYMKYDHSLHAEQDAIVDAIKNTSVDLKNTNIFVVRISPNGEFRMALPCEICSKTIIEMGIKNVYYTNREGLIDRIKSKHL